MGIPLTQAHDVFISVRRDPRDYPHINAIDGWEERCNCSVCGLGEVWATGGEQF